MPSSSSLGKKRIVDWFNEQDSIKTILDLGVGEGTYPKLLGIDKYRWIGVEIYSPYVKKYNLDKLYNELIIGDIFNLKLPEADCVIAGDVLEHLVKWQATEMIHRLDYLYDHVVISIPINYKQDEYQGNKFEKHLSIWSYDELDEIISGSFKVRELFGNIAVFIK